MAPEASVSDGALDASLSRRLAWVTGLKIVFLTMVLLVVVYAFARNPLRTGSFTSQIAAGLLAFGYAQAALSASLIRAGKGIGVLADVQVVLDQMVWTGIVYLSGGAASGATSFYGLTCLAGATLTGLRGAGLAAVAAGSFYGGLVTLLALGWLPPPPDQPARIYVLAPTELAYFVLVNLLALIVVSVLSGLLAERLRLTGGQLVVAKARAEQAERMAALGRLAAGLAHEIRNPLGSISGSIQLLRESPLLNAEEQQLCDIIQRESSRLNDLVTDMMDLSKPRKPELSPVDLVSVVRDVVELARRSGRAVADVSVGYEGLATAIVRADGSQLRQMVWNLVRNAVQASSAGEEVSVRVVREGESIWLYVEDHGIGIDAQAKDRLFDAFFTTRSKGTGVGLAVVKRIVDDHGFEIEVDSQRGEGAVFSVRMSEVPDGWLGPSSGGEGVA